MELYSRAAVDRLKQLRVPNNSTCTGKNNFTGEPNNFGLIFCWVIVDGQRGQLALILRQPNQNPKHGLRASLHPTKHYHAQVFVNNFSR